MLTTIHLHGKIGHMFGRVWKLNVENVGEALGVICKSKKGFADYMVNSEKKGIVFRVLDDSGKAVSCIEKLITMKPTELHLWPVVVGSKRAGAFQTILGVILIIVAVIMAFTPANGGSAPTLKGGMALLVGSGGMTFTSFMFMMGMAMTIGGIAQLLTPLPSVDTTTAEDDSSNIFNGSNLAGKQGMAVPIGYGTLHVSGTTISAGISSDKTSSEIWRGNDTDGDGIIDDFDGDGINDDYAIYQSAQP